MQDNNWVNVVENDDRIAIETPELEVAIPKRNPKHWMTGTEKESFRDKATGFHEAGDGLMVIDWLMEPGSDEEYADQLDDNELTHFAQYVWYENETDPKEIDYARNAHGSSHRKRAVEGPQLCHRLKPVQPEIIQGEDFIAVKTQSRFEFAAPGRQAGSLWTQLIVFPKGKRYFLLMDQIDSINDSPEMFLRNDTPGVIRHNEGDTFSEVYLSYLGGPNGTLIPSHEFFKPFPPDMKFGYRRDQNVLPETFIRGYRLRDKDTGAQGPWLAGMTLEPEVVYEAWWSQRNENVIVTIEEVHGKPVKAGESFSAAHLVGFFDSVEEMHEVYEHYKGHTALSADASGWRLEK